MGYEFRIFYMLCVIDYMLAIIECNEMKPDIKY